ncbi:MAG: hypothetical protein AAFX79_06700 [Planctomycetota bacterium]
MAEAVIRWTLYIAALVVVGPIAGGLAAMNQAADGSEGTILLSRAPVLGVVGLAGGGTLAAILGAVSARFCGARAGLTTAGIVLAWMAGRTASTAEIIRAQGTGPWTSLVIEGVLVAVMLAGVGAAIGVLAKPVEAQHGVEAERGVALSGRSALAIAAAVVAGGALVWVFAVTPLKGQAIAAAGLAAVGLTLVVRVIDRATPALGAVLACAVLAVAGPAFALATVPPGDALAASYAQQLPAVSRPTPLDWSAGALLGIPIGLAWAASILKRADA